jgi:hypothetical protein
VARTPKGMIAISVDIDGVMTASPLPNGSYPNLVPTPTPPIPQQAAGTAAEPTPVTAAVTAPVVCECACPNSTPVPVPSAPDYGGTEPSPPPTAGYDGEG